MTFPRISEILSAKQQLPKLADANLQLASLAVSRRREL